MRIGGAPLAMAALLAVLSGLARAGDDAPADGDPVQAFRLAETTLGDALRKFSEQTGIAIIYDNRIVSGRRAPIIDGELTSRAALARLLAGSPLEFREINASTLAIIERAPTVDHVIAPTEIIPPPEDEQRVDQIIVTASYRTPSADAGARVQYTLDGESLQLTGAQNVAEPILDLPATVASFSSANTAQLLSAGGLNLTDLRGLGPERSLVLVNGRRFIRTPGGNGTIYGVDLNNIPTPFVERVEIINQGAGPTLGTDAVAGAVNIVTREHIDGFAISGNGGLSEQGDAREYSASALAGARFADGRGQVSAGVAYASDPQLLYGDRARLSEPYGFEVDGFAAPEGAGNFSRGFGLSPITPAGSVVGGVTAAGDTVLFFDYSQEFALSGDGSGFEPFVGRLDQLFNWAEDYTALQGLDRLHAYAKGEFELSDRWRLYSEAIFADVETAGQIASAPVMAFRGASLTSGDALIVPADDPNAPPGLGAAIEAAIGAPVDQLLIGRRFTELGPRLRRIDRRTLQTTAGITGDLGAGWSLDFSYQFGLNDTRDVASGVADGARVATAIDTVQCAATPGCVPVNIFAGETITPEQAAFYRGAPRARDLMTREHVARLSVSGPLYTLGEEEARLFVGGEFRRDRLQSRTPPEQADDVALAEFRFADSDGAVDYAELFAGADLPLLADAPFAHRLSLGGDVRLTRWSGGGFVENVSGDLSWFPTRGLEIYAYALWGGRAPNVVELTTGGSRSPIVFFDPCAYVISDVITENCAADGPLGTPDGFTQTNNLYTPAFSGNPELDRERVHSRNFGAAIDFHELVEMGDDALRISADWRHVFIRNQLFSQGGDQIVFGCYGSENLSNQFCGVNPATGNLYIQRDPTTRQIVRVESTLLNGARTRTSGLDVNLAYQSDLDWAPLLPTFSLDILYAYLHRYRVSEPDRGGVFKDSYARLHGLIEYPRHQIFATASLETERFKTLWTVRRRGAAATAFTDIPEAQVPARVYVDAGFQFRPTEELIFYAGVENLMNTQVPIVAFARRGFYTEFYDPIGRRYFAGFTAQF